MSLTTGARRTSEPSGGRRTEHDMLGDIDVSAGITALTEHCVHGITANRQRLARTVAASTGPVPALSPTIGHENACAIALEAHRTGRPAPHLVRERRRCPRRSRAH
ncbi:hypothetical protein NKH77_52910 [Streptomyces sp. M19]